MNRIGLHITNGTQLALGRPRIVKLFECSPEYARQVRDEVGPECLIVVRWYEPEQRLDEPELDAERWLGRRYLGMRLMAEAAGPVVFEGYNEIADSQAPAFARFEARRVELMHEAGLRCGVGSWSVGTPDLPTWPIYLPVLRAMGRADSAHSDVVCLHEYWADRADIGNHWLTGRFAHPAVAPFLAGLRIAITECGRDQVAGRGQPGWQRTCNAGQYLDDLRAYDALLAGHPQVIGATVFNAGGNDPQWGPFDAAPVWPQVVAEYTEEAAPVPGEVTMPLLPMDGRLVDVAGFRAIVESANLGWVQRVVIHHTASPDKAAWTHWGGFAYWKLRLREYYSGKGWAAMPHLFAGPDGIGILWDIERQGRGVGGGALEAGCLHIEIVGNYTDHVPVGATLDNAVWAAALVLNRARLGMEALTNHSRVVGGTTECPGLELRRNWTWFAEQVAAARVPEVLAGEPLPQHELATSADVLAQKVRWWAEELARQLQAGNEARARAILDGLISLEYGLMYRLERALQTA